MCWEKKWISVSKHQIVEQSEMFVERKRMLCNTILGKNFMNCAYALCTMNCAHALCTSMALCTFFQAGRQNDLRLAPIKLLFDTDDWLKRQSICCGLHIFAAIHKISCCNNDILPTNQDELAQMHTTPGICVRAVSQLYHSCLRNSSYSRTWKSFLYVNCTGQGLK